MTSPHTTRESHDVDWAQPEQPARNQPYGQAYPPADTTGYLPYPDNGRTQAEYGQQPFPGQPSAEDSGTRTLWILSFVFAAVALVFWPVGLAAITCGAVAWKRGSGKGRTATIVSAVTTVLGVALAILAYTM
jgi:hypothetical protein